MIQQASAWVIAVRLGQACALPWALACHPGVELLYASIADWQAAWGTAGGDPDNGPTRTWWGDKRSWSVMGTGTADDPIIITISVRNMRAEKVGNGLWGFRGANAVDTPECTRLCLAAVGAGV